MVYADNSIVSESGSRYRTVYSPKVDEEGRIELVESGKEDFQEYIDSFRESCDIRQIIRRVEEGDLSALNQRQGFYGDVTKMPKTYAEMLQLQIDAKNDFDRLPLEIKHKFDDDANVYFATAGSKEWFEKLGVIKEEEKVNQEIVTE